MEDLDGDVREDDRHPKDGAYTVRVRRRVEVDEENKNLSAEQLKTKGDAGITLLEYLLLFLGYYITTKKCLDEVNWTLCSGSRYSDGCVPHAYWLPGHREFYVRWAGSDYRDERLCSRSVCI